MGLKIRIDLRDLLWILGSFEKVVDLWPPARSRLVQATEIHPVLFPFRMGIDQIVDAFQEDGVEWRDFGVVMMQLPMLVSLWPMVRAELVRMLESDPAVAPLVDLFEELVERATT